MYLSKRLHTGGLNIKTFAPDFPRINFIILPGPAYTAISQRAKKTCLRWQFTGFHIICLIFYRSVSKCLFISKEIWLKRGESDQIDTHSILPLSLHQKPGCLKHMQDNLDHEIIPVFQPVLKQSFADLSKLFI